MPLTARLPHNVPIHHRIQAPYVTRPGRMDAGFKAAEHACGYLSRRGLRTSIPRRYTRASRSKTRCPEPSTAPCRTVPCQKMTVLGANAETVSDYLIVLKCSTGLLFAVHARSDRFHRLRRPFTPKTVIFVQTATYPRRWAQNQPRRRQPDVNRASPRALRPPAKPRTARLPAPRTPRRPRQAARRANPHSPHPPPSPSSSRRSRPGS